MLPSTRRVVVYIQPGSVSADRQLRHCVDWCEQHGYDIAAIAPDIKDAVTSAAGTGDLVVAAFAARSRPGDLRSQARVAGVKVAYVRPPVVRREIAEMLVAMYRRSNRNVRGMADMLGESTSGLMATLDSLGILNEENDTNSNEE